MEMKVTNEQLTKVRDALELIDNFDDKSKLNEAIELLDAALAKPVQEPVARVTGYYAGRCVIEPLDGKSVFPTGMAMYSAPVAAQAAQPFGWLLDAKSNPAFAKVKPDGIKEHGRWTAIYTAPPSREWVELEDDDVIEIADRCTDVFGLADLISEALRTKNTGER